VTHARDDVLEQFSFLAKLLRAFLIAPDFGGFQLAYDFGQPVLFGIDVKGTSAARLGEPEGRIESRQSD